MEINMVVRDLLFVNYAVNPARLRALVPAELELDLLPDETGREVGIVSAVCFHAAEVQTNLLPVSRLSFEQVNYRTYLNNDERAAVYFFDMKANSRMVAAAARLAGAPLGYEAIRINTAADSSDESVSVLRVESDGIEASVQIGGPRLRLTEAACAVSPDFITERSVGYARAGQVVHRFIAEHSPIQAVAVRVESARAPALVSLGLLTDESTQPVSAFYASEARFKARAAMRIG